MRALRTRIWNTAANSSSSDFAVTIEELVNQMQSRLCRIIIHLFEKRPVAGDAGVAGRGRGGGQEASSGFLSGTVHFSLC
jgi:hypothetical protein